MTAIEALIYDVGFELKERALQAASARRTLEQGSAEYAFEAGRALAYSEIISLIQQTARGLGIDLEMVRLADIDPERDLL